MWHIREQRVLREVPYNSPILALQSVQSLRPKVISILRIINVSGACVIFFERVLRGLTRGTGKAQRGPTTRCGACIAVPFSARSAMCCSHQGTTQVHGDVICKKQAGV